MKAAHIRVRVNDGLVWESDAGMRDVLSSGLMATAGPASDGKPSEFWRSGQLAVWSVDGAWIASYRDTMASGFTCFEDAARRAAALKQEIDGEIEPITRATA